MTFRAPAAGALRAARLDTMTALYDRRSGMTHLTAEVVPAILEALAEGEANVDMLALRLNTTEHAALTERLEELAAIGLVERL